MKVKHFTCALLFLLGISISASACSKPGHNDLRIILIRHGEKPDNGDNLSCAGLNRALKLSEVLKNKFGIPDYIYAPSPATGKQTKNCRMLQTIMPFAVKYNLNINTAYSVDESDKLTNNIRKNSGTIFVVWEHKELATIAAMLGVKGSLKWDTDDYDSIWIITYKHGEATLTKDKEGITPAAGCAF